MNFAIIWKEGRIERHTETEIDPNKSWEETSKQIKDMLVKAYKYNTQVELPKWIIEEHGTEF